MKKIRGVKLFRPNLGPGPSRKSAYRGNGWLIPILSQSAFWPSRPTNTVTTQQWRGRSDLNHSCSSAVGVGCSKRPSITMVTQNNIPVSQNAVYSQFSHILSTKRNGSVWFNLCLQ